MILQRLRRGAAVVAVVLVVITAGLALWDGGVDQSPRRELLPGVTIDLRSAETARGLVEYDLYGTTGPVVLSVHAGLGGADQGRLFTSWLQEDGYRILSPSRPGYLGTPLSSGRTVDEQADLLAALLDTLGIDRVGVFAVSAGAPVGATFAARHPGRVWGLVTVGGVTRADPGAGPGSAVRGAFFRTIGQKLARITAWVSPGSIAAGTLDETSLFTDAQKSERVAYIVEHDDVEALFRAMFETTFPYDRRQPGTENDAVRRRELAVPFARITAPTLIVHGTLDGDVPLADGEFAAAHIPGAQHHWSAGEDHLGFWLSPRAAETQDAVRAFLRRAATTATR